MSKRAVAKEHFAKCNCSIMNEHQKVAGGPCALGTDCTERAAVRAFLGQEKLGKQHCAGGTEGFLGDLDDTETQIWSRRKKITTLLSGNLYAPNADCIDPNQVSSLVC